LALALATQQTRIGQGALTEGGTRSKTLRKNAKFYTPPLTFLGETFLVVFFIDFGRVFLSSFRKYKF
jgi:hypothetical protein